MANILLVNPLIREWALPNCVPSGLLYLSSVLRREGHHVDIFDWNGHRYSNEEVENYIKRSGGDYDLIGIGGIITMYKKVKWFSALAKKYHPHVPIIAGGALATSIPQILLENTEIDMVNIGEGELTIVDLVLHLENLEKVKGIWYKENGGIRANSPREIIEDLDSIPFPDYENLDTLEIYLKNPIGYLNVRKWIDGKAVADINSMNMVTARSCPYSCNFCYSKYLGPKYRKRSPKNIVEEMKYLVEELECGYIHFTDELSLLTKKDVLALCDEIEQQGLKVMWGAPIRLDFLDKESLERLNESGCVLTGPGIESFSPKVLHAMNKQLNIEKVKGNLVIARKIIKNVSTAFIIGYPGETRETIQESIDACKSINLVPTEITFPTPYPATVLYEFALKNGYIKDEVKYIESLSDHEQGEFPIINFTDLSDEELIKEKERWFRETGKTLGVEKFSGGESRRTTKSNSM